MADKLTEEDRINVLIIKGNRQFGQQERSLEETRRIFNDNFPNHTISKSTVERIVKKFREAGTVRDLPRSGRNKSATSPEKEEEILLSYIENPHTSTRKASQATDVGATSVRKVLHGNGYFPFKYHEVQELSEDDFQRRIRFCEQIRRKVDDVPNFLNHLIFSDEATFYLNGTLNKQNARQWSDENPHWKEETHTQTPQKINVWLGVVGINIIGPYFFRENFNGQNYLELLRTRVIPQIQHLYPNEQFRNIWFQQDGAPAHYFRVVRDFLTETFGDQWIGRRPRNPANPNEDVIDWPARSPDLTLLDFFVWGYVKDRVFETKPTTLDELQNRIQDVIDTITPEMLRNAQRAFYDRIGHCEIEGGRHFEHLL